MHNGGMTQQRGNNVAAGAFVGLNHGYFLDVEASGLARRHQESPDPFRSVLGRDLIGPTTTWPSVPARIRSATSAAENDVSARPASGIC
jgi:hypothetical protein